MDLWLPDRITLAPVTQTLIDDVQAAARRVDGYRPLPPDVVQRIDEDLLGERVYGSNAIEGSTLDLRETVLVLRQGIGALVKKKREATEARNLGNAARRIGEWTAASEDCHTVDRLCEIHRLVLQDLDEKCRPGSLRTDRVMIAGAKHQPPRDDLVPTLLEQAMEVLRAGRFGDAVTRGAWAHWAIARIHPFHDGNGRMARLWQDLVLMQGGLTCGVIRPEERRDYLASLAEADEGRFDPLVQLVARRVAETFDKYDAHIASRPALEEWATAVAGEADARAAESRKLEYDRWARRMEQLRAEFEICAAKVSERLSSASVQVQRFDMLDQSRWESLRAGAGAERTWCFIVRVHKASRWWKYYFFFGKHYWMDEDTDEDRAQHRVCLLVSRSEGHDDAVRLDQIPRCAVTLRQIFVVHNRLVRVRAEGDRLRYDRDLSALQIAQDFLGEALLGSND